MDGPLWPRSPIYRIALDKHKDGYSETDERNERGETGARTTGSRREKRRIRSKQADSIESSYVGQR